MSQSLNKIRNPDFSGGCASPTGWQWKTVGGAKTWVREAESGSSSGGLTIISNDVHGLASFAQVVTCKPRAYYRIEAVVLAELSGDDPDAGFVLEVSGVSAGQRGVGSRITDPVCSVREPSVVRAFYQVPDKVRRIEVSLGIRASRGSVTLLEVRSYEILEPDHASHVLSLPPPAVSILSPRSVRKTCVCTSASRTENLIAQLRAYSGNRAVQIVLPEVFSTSECAADAIILPDADPPPSLRSYATLERLARDRIVVISLPAFAKLSNGNARISCVGQEDDPAFARIVFANYATAGFALADCIPFGWPDKSGRGFVQNQFRDNPRFRQWCEHHGLTVLLKSECARESTSDRPVALCRVTERGALFVLDTDAAGASPSTLGEPFPALHLLLTALGHSTVGLGQYVVPERDEHHFRTMIRETAERLPPLMVHDDDLPANEVTDQLVTLGGDDQSFGLPLQPRPLILVRTGLFSGDFAAVYGALLWFKQLVRIEPHRAPYADVLTSRFRLAWIPSLAPWEGFDGFESSKLVPRHSWEIDLDGATVAALIDIVSRPINEIRVCVSASSPFFDRCQRWLPELWKLFPAGAPQNWHSDGREKQKMANPTESKTSLLSLNVLARDEITESAFPQQILNAKGVVSRIEIPYFASRFAYQSIHATDIVATLLEQVIGLQFGIIAVNRRRRAVRLDGFPPVESGKALILPESGLVHLSDALQVG